MSSEDAEDLLHDSVIELFDLSDYSSALPNNAKERYVAKLNEVQCDCPYVIENEYWTSSTNDVLAKPGSAKTTTLLRYVHDL
ncbi:hypothetical protein GHT06_001542 [Daphnia sinensis]|uniref:Uncharacterized protein n=1 Tax=Daphnia sinensis TaxID=1820382 RepID=A0AAD5PNY7_9CRUS|nr:hypothetical protein GHT06_001542 [Daphnia sinensis]